MRRLTKTCFGLCTLIVSLTSFSQTIGTFNSIKPTAQTQNLVLPSTHTFQRIIRTGDTLTTGETMGNTPDFTAYVPINGSSTNGYLSINSETGPAENAILSLSYNSTTKLWGITNSGKVSLPLFELGGTLAFCSGEVTSKGTVLVCEESVTPAGDYNFDGYQDAGWILEIDPATRKVINQDGIGGADKLWAMGRQIHEDVTISADTAAYWSADDATTGYIYKFVPTVPGNYSQGKLYVLQTTASLNTGTWKQLDNTTKSNLNNTVALSTSAGAYNFDRVEGIAKGPDGKVYFVSTTTGTIYRFHDNGSGVDQLEVFVAPGSYDVDGAGPFLPEPWGYGPDNLAFDGEGNLWVLQDGGRNHIWVVSPDHTTATPHIRLFATTPAGSEPTGITFSPDYNYIFLSLQHPSTGNVGNQVDAAGKTVVFNTHTIVAIARKENLGAATVVPEPLFITCPGNKSFTLAAGVCSIVVNGIDPVTGPAGNNPSYKYVMTGATVSTKNGSASGKTFQPGVTTVTYSLLSDTTKKCSFTITVQAQMKTYYRDLDKDGYGDPKVSRISCPVPTGYVLNNTDCNDADSTVHPGAPELCDGKDNDCNGIIDDGLPLVRFYQDYDKDGYGNVKAFKLACAAPPGYVADSTDCNDHDINTHPGAVEIADGLDNNCDGQRDEGFPQFTFYQDLDKDGYGNPKVFISANVAPPGYVSNNLDCNDNDKTIYPGAPELCDGKDNNCNGIIDDGLPLKRFYLDSDKDKYGNVKYYKYACAAPAGYVADSTDCNDKNAAIHPGAAEIPGNGIDDNCNGLIDETTTTISANGMELYPEEETPLSVAVHPNPGISYFTVSINSVGAKLVQLRVFDELGRVVESKNNLNPKTTITIGHHYTPGIYFMEAVQGNKRVILKLMKS